MDTIGTSDLSVLKIPEKLEEWLRRSHQTRIWILLAGVSPVIRRSSG
jgi:hypothetical protein